MRTIEIVDYDPGWVDEFVRWARLVRTAVADSVLRIDHIGSTSVPGLAAKNVIDMQITVADLDDVTPVERLVAAGFRQREGIGTDLLVGVDEEGTLANPELRKRYLREPEGERRLHIHMRESNRINQRYALLFRDYLRAHERVRRSYEIVKRRLAVEYPHDIDGYLSIKDPYMDTVYEGAQHWAQLTGWKPDECYA